MKKEIYDQLRSLSPKESTNWLLDHLQVWIADITDKPLGQITPATTFGELNTAWQDHAILAEALVPLLEERLGFWSIPDELSGKEQLSDLASHLSAEIQTAVPAAGYTDPYHGGVWAWSPPASYPYAANSHDTAIFLLGVPRSGTTLLRAMLAGHPKLFAPPELSLLPFDTLAAKRQEMARVGIPINEVHHNLAQVLMHLGNWSNAKAEAEINATEAASVPMGAVYQRLQELACGRRVVDKSPLYLSHVDWLQRAEQMFVAPKYLFLIRHPYPVIESMVRHRFNRWLGNWFGFWDDNPWLFAEKLWAIYSHNLLAFQKRLPQSRQHLLRYEDLVTQPEAELGRVCQFLKLEFDRAVLDPYQGARMLDGTGDAGLKYRGRIQSDLAVTLPHDRPPQLLNELTLQVSARLGYELS